MSQEVEDDHISFFNGLVYLLGLPFGCFGASQLGQRQAFPTGSLCSKRYFGWWGLSHDLIANTPPDKGSDNSAPPLSTKAKVVQANEGSIVPPNARFNPNIPTAITQPATNAAKRLCRTPSHLTLAATIMAMLTCTNTANTTCPKKNEILA